MDVVYIERSIVSHATSRPSSDQEIAVLQAHAKRWMNEHRPDYEVVTSRVVVAEARRGDADAAARRLAMLSDIPLIDDNPDVDAVADEFIRQSIIPDSARLDALHVASAALAHVK